MCLASHGPLVRSVPLTCSWRACRYASLHARLANDGGAGGCLFVVHGRPAAFLTLVGPLVETGDDGANSDVAAAGRAPRHTVHMRSDDCTHLRTICERNVILAQTAAACIFDPTTGRLGVWASHTHGSDRCMFDKPMILWASSLQR